MPVKCKMGFGRNLIMKAPRFRISEQTNKIYLCTQKCRPLISGALELFEVSIIMIFCARIELLGARKICRRIGLRSSKWSKTLAVPRNMEDFELCKGDAVERDYVSISSSIYYDITSSQTREYVRRIPFSLFIPAHLMNSTEKGITVQWPHDSASNMFHATRCRLILIQRIANRPEPQYTMFHCPKSGGIMRSRNAIAYINESRTHTSQLRSHTHTRSHGRKASASCHSSISFCYCIEYSGDMR